MLGVHVGNQKINLGAMVLIQEVNLFRMFLRQKKAKMALCACANRQRILHFVMARTCVCKKSIKMK